MWRDFIFRKLSFTILKESPNSKKSLYLKKRKNRSRILVATNLRPLSKSYATNQQIEKQPDEENINEGISEFSSVISYVYLYNNQHPCYSYVHSNRKKLQICTLFLCSKWRIHYNCINNWTCQRYQDDQIICICYKNDFQQLVK